ncbi:MAG: SRPBCC domain-containing protein [Acidobacteria bacterium]|nr:SRPBCC domain-containing protein [Acidobacteriota bacterium]
MPDIMTTLDQDTLVSEIHVAAPPERVFQALSDPRQLSQWFAGSESCKKKSWEFEARKGGKWRMADIPSAAPQSGSEHADIEVHGEIVEYDPPRTLAYTWLANSHQNRLVPTLVRWELSPIGNGTRVKVIHSGLAGEDAARKDYAGGWPGVVASLKQYVEQN